MAPEPIRLCPQPWPLGLPLFAGAFFGTVSLPNPGSASNSTRIPRTGEPLPQVAIHAVSMPAMPRSLMVKPFFSSTADS
jgi:hypothetical protein